MSNIQRTQGAQTTSKIVSEIDTERVQIKENGQELFKGYGISWYKLGFSNYIKSWISSDYANKVRDEFFVSMKTELSDLKAIGNLRPNQLSIDNKEQTRSEYFRELFQNVMKIPDYDMSIDKKLKLIANLTNKDVNLEKQAKDVVGDKYVQQLAQNFES